MVKKMKMNKMNHLKILIMMQKMDIMLMNMVTHYTMNKMNISTWKIHMKSTMNLMIMKIKKMMEWKIMKWMNSYAILT